MKITITIRGLNEAIASSDELVVSLNDFTEAMVAIGEELAGEAGYFSEAPFITQGGVFGQTWQALKATTVHQKLRHAGQIMAGMSPALPLVQTGALKRGFRYAATPISLFIDNKVDYWKYHQTGTGEKGAGTVPGVGRGKNLPQRMTLGINQPVKAIITNSMGIAVKTKIAEAFGGS